MDKQEESDHLPQMLETGDVRVASQGACYRGSSEGFRDLSLELGLQEVSGASQPLECPSQISLGVSCEVWVSLEEKPPDLMRLGEPSEESRGPPI